MTEHEFKMGDEVVAWDDHAVDKARGRFVSYYPLHSDYPFKILLDDGRVEEFGNCIPYKAPSMRPMTHKEVFELMAREPVVFRYVGGNNTWMINHWDNGKNIEDFEYCPVAELVEPLTESPWRKLEVEE